jgi:hypothetical protein
MKMPNIGPDHDFNAKPSPPLVLPSCQLVERPVHRVMKVKGKPRASKPIDREQ